jgi:hypothetical protein
MSCTCCQGQLNSGMVQKIDENTGERYKSCPHCTEAHGSEHVFHRYPSDFGNTPARVTARNPHGHQSYCKECRSLARGVSSSAYARGTLCSHLV